MVIKTIIKRLAKSKHLLHTISFDNDKGFAFNMSIANALNADTNFARPYTSQDKGTVENRIGQLRRFFPKKTDLSIITDDQVKLVERLLNNRPVRNLIIKLLTKCYLKKMHLLLENS